MGCTDRKIHEKKTNKMHALLDTSESKKNQTKDMTPQLISSVAARLADINDVETLHRLKRVQQTLQWKQEHETHAHRSVLMHALGFQTLVQLNEWLRQQQCSVEHNDGLMQYIITCLKTKSRQDQNVLYRKTMYFNVTNAFINQRLMGHDSVDILQSERFVIQTVTQARQDNRQIKPVTMRQFSIVRRATQHSTCLHSVQAHTEMMAKTKVWHEHMTHCLLTPPRTYQKRAKIADEDERPLVTFSLYIGLSAEFWNELLQGQLIQWCHGQRYCESVVAADFHVSDASTLVSSDAKMDGCRETTPGDGFARTGHGQSPSRVGGHATTERRFLSCCHRSDDACTLPYRMQHVLEDHAYECQGNPTKKSPKPLDYLKQQAHMLRKQMPTDFADYVMTFVSAHPDLYGKIKVSTKTTTSMQTSWSWPTSSKKRRHGSTEATEEDSDSETSFSTDDDVDSVTSVSSASSVVVAPVDKSMSLDE